MALRTPSIFRKFVDMEESMSLFALEVDGVRIWERIRAPLYLRLQNRIISKKEETKPKQSLKKRIMFYIKSIIRLDKNPLFSFSKDVLICGSQRRFLHEDGKWWDIYTDYILDKIEHSTISIERSWQLGHRKPSKTKNLYYFDIMETLIFIANRLKLFQVNLQSHEMKSLLNISREIKKRFNIYIDVMQYATTVLSRRKIKLAFYRVLLKRINPKLVLLVVSYEREDLIEACKELGIPTVELQHGVISPHHPGYSFPPSTKQIETFPDYILLFGDYWKTRSSFPISSNRLVPVGYPHMENMLIRCKRLNKRKQVVFISQPMLGDGLVKFAVQLSQIDDFDYDIIFKLHPKEIANWKEKYPLLVDTDIIVADSLEQILYDLFAQSVAQIGVSSTALYEGMAFNLETFIIDIPSSSYFHDLIEEGLVHLVSRPEQIRDILINKSTTDEIETSKIFLSSSTERILEFINRMVNRNA
ncbi:MAG: hypothetical protein GF411_19800 [Candidatus Lokiarchaeota archaeon]|nr:hypothetical protein [Candidatus Lokiarchaeota archaeon]